MRGISWALLPLLWCLRACDSTEPSESLADGSVDSGDQSMGPAPLARPFDIVGIVGTGQSLSVGVSGAPALSTSQPDNNLKLGDPDFSGDLSAPPAASAALVPLTEPLRLYNPRMPAGPNYPNNLSGETPHTAMGAELTRLARAADGADYVSFHSAVGASGQSITWIRKGGTGNSYAAALYEARTAAALARRAGRSFGYGAILMTHGETDAARVSYGADVFQLFQDYNADLKAITGQTQDIPMLISQQGTFPPSPGGAESTLAAWRLGVEHPGQVLCTGPKYQYEYAPDRVHLTANSYRRLGQKYAQVYFQHVVQGRPWRPLQPRTVAKSGAELVVTFDVPVPPLRFDERIPAPHQTLNKQWAAGRGFEVSDGQGAIGINAVALQGAEQVKLTLARAPGAGLILAYAFTQDVAGYQGGQTDGRQGQLRDSDERVGYDEETIPCSMTKGSTGVTALGMQDFSRRSLRDVVVGDGLAPDTVISARGPKQLVLSAPWTGASGAATLKIHNDLHNYAVQFAMAVP